MKRLISGLVGLPLVLAAVYLPGKQLFLGIVTVLALLGILEYVRLCRIGGAVAAAATAGVVLAVGIAPSQKVLTSPGLAVVLLLAVSLWRVDDMSRRFQQSAEALVGMVCISFAFICLYLIRELPSGSAWVTVTLGMLWGGDTSAYYGGSRFGRRKLSPLLSPNKTWEGSACGLAGSLLAGLVLAMLLLRDVAAANVAVMSLAVGMSGQVGDLLESLWKRVKGVKDSGGMIPGHGGLLDRIDSLLLGVPVAYHLVSCWVQ